MELASAEGGLAMEAFRTEVEAMSDDELRRAKAAHDATTAAPGDELHFYKGLALEATSLQRFGLPLG